jgi:hypothetical protein
MLVKCSFLTIHWNFCFYILTFQHSNCVDKFFHHVSSMWPTPHLEGGNGSNEEDQVRINIWTWFRRQLSLISYLFVYVLHLELRILHFCAFHHSSHIHSQVLCIPRLCICVHCWNVKKIRVVWGLTFVFLKAPSYILHFVFVHCVCTFCLCNFLIFFLNYILHCVCAFFCLCIHLSSL